MTAKNIQSMEEIMLEFIVMNYQEVFASLLKGSCTSSKQLLPPSLFENIIYKSKEMKWRIDPLHMENLLTFRDVLSWKNINVNLHPTYSISTNMLEKMSLVEYPIITLSIKVDVLAYGNMYELWLMGSTIEWLEIKYSHRYIKKEILEGHFPNLRKLSLSRIGPYEHDNKLYIDLSQFSDTLEELKLENEHLDNRLIRSIACLKKLKVLSLPFSSADYPKFRESLQSMNHLRTLDLRYFKQKCSPSHFQTSKLLSVISEMPNLENFDTSLQTFTEKNILKSVKYRKWNKFGFYDIDAKDFQQSYDKLKLLADEVFGLFEETILSSFEIYEQYYVPEIISRFFTFLPLVPQDLIVRAENIILNIFAGDFEYRREILEYIKTGRYTDDFITKLIILITSYFDKERNLETSIRDVGCIITNIVTSAPVARKMLEIVKKNLNKGLCRKLLNMFLICSYKGLTKDIRDPGLRDVCKKAVENNFLDDDTLLAMTKRLEKISQNQIHIS